MHVTAKTVIKAYGRLARVAEDIEAMIEKSAIGSFSSREPASVQIEKICKLIELKNALVNLKVLARNAFKAIDDSDFDVLAKHFGKSDKELYFAKRTYYRKVLSALSAYESQLAIQGLTREVFEREYAKKISFIGVLYDMVLAEERQTAERVKKLTLNRSFGKGTYRES